MSVSVLSSHQIESPSAPSHDQLDELKSCFSALCELTCSRKSVGIMVDEPPQEVRACDGSPKPVYCLAIEKKTFGAKSTLKPATSPLYGFHSFRSHCMVRSLLVADSVHWVDSIVVTKARSISLASACTISSKKYDIRLSFPISVTRVSPFP